MFGIGMPELVVILVVALIVLGPKRLPEVARQLGKAMAEFRRQSSDLLEEFQSRGLLEDEPDEHKPPRPGPPPPAGGSTTEKPASKQA